MKSQRSNLKFLARATSAALVCAFSLPASAAVSTGVGGKGVTVGNSGLYSAAQLVYSDTFTGTADGGKPSRPYAAAVQGAAAYPVEKTYGNPQVSFTSQSTGAGIGEFSFAADGAGTPGLINGVPNYPGTSGAGSATGFTQTGGSLAYGVPYGVTPAYFVQVDAVQSANNIGLTTGATPGTAANNLSVFFKGDGTIHLFDGTTDTQVTGIPLTGLEAPTRQWNNYAVRFDKNGKTVQAFLNEISVANVNLATFAGGIYQNSRTPMSASRRSCWVVKTAPGPTTFKSPPSPNPQPSASPRSPGWR